LVKFNNKFVVKDKPWGLRNLLESILITGPRNPQGCRQILVNPSPQAVSPVIQGLVVGSTLNMPVGIKSVRKQYQILFRGIPYFNPFKQYGKRTIEGPRNCVYSDRFIRKFTCSVPTPTGSISVNSDRSRSERSSRQIYPFGQKSDWVNFSLLPSDLKHGHVNVCPRRIGNPFVRKLSFECS
jgi:hypothetical protein